MYREVGEAVLSIQAGGQAAVPASADSGCKKHNARFIRHKQHP
jgi:hypothetical protein